MKSDKASSPLKTYVVMTDYGPEGWKISGQTDDFQEAFGLREESMGNGNSKVVMFKTVHWVVREAL